MSNKGYKQTPEHVAKRMTPETRAKISSALLGKKHAPEHIANRVEARRANGTYGLNEGLLYKVEVGYHGAHKRAKGVLPMQCQECGTVAGILEAALRKDAPTDSLRTDPHGKRFSIALPPTLGYVRLCRSCHRAYDKDAYSGSNHWRAKV